MKCTEVLKIYQLFVDGEMDDSAIDQIKQHMESCPDCQYRIQFEVRFKSTITRKIKSESTSAPKDLKERILDELSP